MNSQSLLYSTAFYFVFLGILSGVLFLFNQKELFSYIDMAVCASGIAFLLLLARKYMVRGYGNEKYHDFFMIDSFLILFGMGVLVMFFIIQL